MAIDPAQRAAELKRFHNVLEDRPLPPGDPAYVPDIHKDAGDPVVDLKTQIDFTDSANVYFFTGQRGTGKSSELLRLKGMLESEGCFVLLADMSQYLSLTEPIELGDFMISIMGALSDQVEALFHQAPAQQNYWERIAHFLQTEVQIKDFDFGGKGAHIKLALKDELAFKRRIQTETADHTVKIVKEARQFANECVNLIRQERQNPALKVVFIVDSVERIRADDSKRAEEIFRSVVNLFASQIENIRFPLLHVVYSVPPYLTALSGSVGGYFGGAIYSLPSVHVFEKNSRVKSEAGLRILERIIDVRYSNWGEVITRAHLQRLALNSGGDIRDFFRLIRLCLVRAARPGETLPLSGTVVEDAEHMVRNDMLPIAENDLAWLQRIGTSHQCKLPEIEKLNTLARFLESKYVLNYRNGADWYDVHPLLRSIVDQYVPAVANAND